LVPLLFVLLVTAVKDGYDDYGRNKNDRRENAREARVLRDEKCAAPRLLLLSPS